MAFVCLAYGAQKAAKRILAETGVPVVVWVALSIFELSSGRDFLHDVVFETLKSMSASASSALRVVQDAVATHVKTFYTKKMGGQPPPACGAEVKGGTPSDSKQASSSSVQLVELVGLVELVKLGGVAAEAESGLAAAEVRVRADQSQ